MPQPVWVERHEGLSRSCERRWRLSRLDEGPGFGEALETSPLPYAREYMECLVVPGYVLTSNLAAIVYVRKSSFTCRIPELHSHRANKMVATRVCFMP